jgi:hypothetical protein
VVGALGQAEAIADPQDRAVDRRGQARRCGRGDGVAHQVVTEPRLGGAAQQAGPVRAMIPPRFARRR